MKIIKNVTTAVPKTHAVFINEEKFPNNFSTIEIFAWSTMEDAGSGLKKTSVTGMCDISKDGMLVDISDCGAPMDNFLGYVIFDGELTLDVIPNHIKFELRKGL